jgi:hypothetical protein
MHNVHLVLNPPPSPPSQRPFACAYTAGHKSLPLAVIASVAKQSMSLMLLLDRHGRQSGLAMTGTAAGESKPGLAGIRRHRAIERQSAAQSSSLWGRRKRQ